MACSEGQSANNPSGLPTGLEDSSASAAATPASQYDVTYSEPDWPDGTRFGGLHCTREEFCIVSGIPTAEAETVATLNAEGQELRENFFYGRDSGGEWSRLNVPAGDVGDFACGTSTYCVFNSPSSKASSSLSEEVWQALPGYSAFASVQDCVAFFCVAGDFDGGVAMLRNSTWSDRTVLQSSFGQEAILAIACASEVLCWAFDSGANPYLFDGIDWSPTGQLGGGDAFGVQALDCTSTGDCTAISGDGIVYVADGQSWVQVAKLSSASGESGTVVTGLGCTNLNRCIATDTSGQIYVGSGADWTERTDIGVRTTDSFGADAACFSDTTCVVAADRIAIIRP
ncbi:hypothetical protein ACVGOW_27365 [Pseudonocardia saturnea]